MSGGRKAPSESVVRNWIKDGKWEARRAEVDRAAMQRVENMQADRRAADVMRADRVAIILEERLTGPDSPPVKSFEGGMYALRNYRDWIRGLEESQSAHIPVDRIVEEFFQLLSARIPELHKAIEKSWSKIREVLRELKTEQAPPKKIEGRVVE